MKTASYGNAESGFTVVFSNYKRGAKIRNLIFELSKQEFRELTKQPCWYCGSEPANMRRACGCKGYYLYNGIDRVDNNKGYTWENCVTACKTCNRMKNVLSGEQFINQARKIATNLGI